MEVIQQLYSIADELVQTENHKESLNLLKCIQTYRVCPSLDVLLTHKPSLVTHIDELYKLWRRFDYMSEKELAEMSINLIQNSW